MAKPPADLHAALQAQGLLRAFEALPPSHRAEYVRWIDEAKREATRAARIAKTLAMMTANRSAP